MTKLILKLIIHVLQIFQFKKHMPRFVAKEDVEKGLIDPTKPLRQQPHYQKKIEEQQKKKQTKQQPEKNQQKEKIPKKQRQDRPQFNWNKKQITLETKVPEVPKKILVKPDPEKFKVDLNKMRQLKDNLYQQRRKLIDEQNFLIKSNSDSKKSGFTALSKFGGELKQKLNLKKSLFDKIKKLEDERNNIENQLKTLKDQNATLYKPKDMETMSSQQIKERIAQLEQRFSSANLDKKEQTQINNNINLLRRALLKARPDIQIKTQVSKNEDKIKILIDDSRALKKQIDAKYQQLKPLKTEIDQLQKKRKEQEGTITEVKSIEDVRAEYDRKIKEVDTKRDDAQNKIDQLKTKYNKQFDNYEDQQDLLRHIKYVQDQIDYKRKRKQEDERRQKDKEEYQLKKKKEFDERQKRREQRKKQDEQRKQRDEQRKQKLQAERDAFLNRNPNWQTIDLCEFMIRYCENIRPDARRNKVNQDKNVKAQDINLKQQKGWEKQAKSGCQVIVSKKNKLDEETTKKVKKEKKTKVEQNDDSFNHSIDTINRFHDLNILQPANALEIDQTIKQLQQKIEILSKPSEEAIEAFKVKAAKEFDRLHGFSEEDEKEHHNEQKTVRHDKKKEKSGKLELQGADFPELN